MLQQRTWAAALGSACVTLLATGSCHRGGHHEAQENGPTVTHPQYWLANTELRPPAGGKHGFRVTTPVLVELWPDGRVRSRAGAEPAFDGILPEAVLKQPEDNRGLMLYAQRMTDVRWRTADGPVIGRLHPGAFVSVVPQPEAMVRIGNLPFKDVLAPIVAYVERARLGTNPGEPPRARPDPKLRSVRWHRLQLTGWSVDSDPSRMRAVWTSVPCVDLWMSRDAKWMSQYVKGVELFGALDAVNAPWPALQDGMERCPAHAITRQGDRLSWRGSDPSEPFSVVTRIPDGYRPYQSLGIDPLLDRVAHRGRVFWLIDSHSGPRCDEWQFGPARRPDPAGRIEARLVRREKLDGLTAIHPTSYSPGDPHKPAVLHLGTIEFSDGTTLKCECSSDYALLHAEGDELELMSRPLPDPLVAYDPTEVERWFLSMAACQRAKEEATRALEHDGTTAVRLGFHAVVQAFGI